MNEELKIIISAQIDNLKKNISTAKTEVKGFKEHFTDAKKNVDSDMKAIGGCVGTAATGIAAASVAAATGIYKLATGSAATADEIDKMSQKIGISKTAYQEWDYICSQSGVDVGVFKNGVKTLTTVMDSAKSGTESAQATFQALGLTWEDGNGKLKSQEQMMEEAITALAGMENGTERARLAQELFGKAGVELAPVLNSGADGIEELRSRCHELGLVMSDETVNAGVVLGDTIDDVKSTFGAITDRLGAEFMPVIQSVADKILEFMPSIETAIKNGFAAAEKAINFISEHQGLFTAIAIAIGVIVTAIGAYNAIAAVKAAMDAAQVTSLAGLITVHLAHAAAVVASLAPYIAITAAIAAVIAIIVLCVKNWDTIKAKIKEVADRAKEYISNMVKKITEFFSNMKAKIFEKVIAIATGIITKFQQIKEKVFEKVIALATGVITKFQQIKEKIFEKVIAIATGVITKFQDIKTGIATKIQEAKQNVATKFDEIKTNVATKIANIKSTVDNTMTNVKNALLKPVESARDLISGIVDKIKGFFNFTISFPHIKLPHFTISPYGWSVGDLLKGSIPSLGISWYAKGGVFDKPTLFGYGNGMLGGLGENGAEAVVPLEKNTQWLDKIAEKIAAKQSSQPIVLEVDGKTFAEISVASINELTKLRGSLPLKLM